MNKIIFLQSQNEGMRKQNEELQEENFYLREKILRIAQIAKENDLCKIKEELIDYCKF